MRGMGTMRKWEVKYREKGSSVIRKTSHYGLLDYDGVVEFFGLEGDDVEWYDVEEIFD